MDIIENQVCSFTVQIFPSSTSGNPRSFPNLLEGNPIDLKIPENNNVLLKNIRTNSWIANSATNGNSLSVPGSGSPIFTVRFLIKQINDFYRQQRGIVTYPNGQNAFSSANGNDTIEYILNTDSAQIENINLIGSGIQLNQFGYAMASFVAGSVIFLTITIEYQILNNC